jgi:general secretion pathway protein G
MTGLRRTRWRRRGPGFTLTEMVMVCALLVVLASVVLPVAKFSVKRGKEIVLRQHLRTMRNAIDEYKRFSDLGLIAGSPSTR